MTRGQDDGGVSGSPSGDGFFGIGLVFRGGLETDAADGVLGAEHVFRGIVRHVGANDRPVRKSPYMEYNQNARKNQRQSFVLEETEKSHKKALFSRKGTIVCYQWAIYIICVFVMRKKCPI